MKDKYMAALRAAGQCIRDAFVGSKEMAEKAKKLGEWANRAYMLEPECSWVISALGEGYWRKDVWGHIQTIGVATFTRRDLLDMLVALEANDEGYHQFIVGAPGPEWTEWICPYCENMCIEHDGKRYCGIDLGTGNTPCVEPHYWTVDDTRCIKIITNCSWFEEAEDDKGE